MNTIVAAETLLLGAFHSLAEAGRLINDAAGIYDRSGYPSAAALAAFAAELLGQCRILLELWQVAASGETVTVDDVRERTADHLAKQAAGQRSISMTLDHESQLGKLLAARNAAIGTDSYADLDRQVADIDQRIMARRPNDRHKLRLGALYVDIDDAGRDWKVPARLSRAECATIIRDVRNDYAGQRDRMENPEVLSDGALARAIIKLQSKPSLPPPPFGPSAFSV
jgi:AbiV family abortive infection protein